jgi:uncharacterized protein
MRASGDIIAQGQGSRRPPSLLSDDVAYILPMAAFMVFTWAGSRWPSVFVGSYVAKTFITAILLIACQRHFTKITWDYWWLGIILGVAGLFQWVGMEKGLLHIWPNYPRLSAEAFVPAGHFSSPATMWSFIAIRWAGAALVVPFMEELFWRDYLWRTIAAPADFKLARIGEWERGIPLIVVSLFFCSVHIEWITALVWGLMIGGLLIYTRSLGACIIMHGVTNFLLGGYVLYFKDWKFW